MVDILCKDTTNFCCKDGHKIGEDIYSGIINKDCRDSSVYYRNKLIKLGIPKGCLPYLVLKNEAGETHVVLVLDITKQINKCSWEIEKIQE